MIPKRSVCVSFEKRVGFWVRKTTWYVLHLYFHPEIMPLKIKFLPFYNFDLKIINGFLLFQVGFSECHWKCHGPILSVLHHSWKKFEKKNLSVNVVGRLVWTILGLRCRKDWDLGNREFIFYLCFGLGICKQDFLSSQRRVMGEMKSYH